MLFLGSQQDYVARSKTKRGLRLPTLDSWRLALSSLLFLNRWRLNQYLRSTGRLFGQRGQSGCWLNWKLARDWVSHFLLHASRCQAIGCDPCLFESYNPWLRQTSSRSPFDSASLQQSQVSRDRPHALQLAMAPSSRRMSRIGWRPSHAGCGGEAATPCLAATEARQRGLCESSLSSECPANSRIAQLLFLEVAFCKLFCKDT